MASIKNQCVWLSWLESCTRISSSIPVRVNPPNTAILCWQRYRRLSRTYKELLDENGLSFSFGHIRWYTTTFNRCFFRWGKHYPSFTLVWFTAGVCFGVCMMVISVVILSWTLAQTFMKSSSEQVLTPLVRECYYVPAINESLETNLPVCAWSNIQQHCLDLIGKYNEY